MKFYNYLIEGYLRSEYKIGFELEACYRGSDLSKVRDFFKKHWSIGGTLGEDNSIEPNSSNNIAFEYSTNPFNITPKNIDMMIKMLGELKKNRIYTNESCGFHVHVSFPYLKDTDLFWIICNIAVNDDVQDTLLHFKKYDFFDVNQYAKPQFLDDIKTLIKNKNLSFLKGIYSEEKYRVFRIHPQGTLEWRGPRNFLNAGNLRDIKDFIKLLFKFISFTNNFIDSKVIKSGDTVLTRKEFDSIFKAGSVIKIKKAKKSNKFTERTDIAKLVNNNFNWVLDAETYLADIDIKGENLIWNFGIWMDGNWEGGIWEGGEWRQGNWENGTWKDGVWKGGAWENGTWEFGTWKNGIWYKGNWGNGTWENGTWKNGTWRGGLWIDGTWKDGTWENGTWRGGTWTNGTWKGGEWYKGNWENGTWKNGSWDSGTWENGIWYKGTWEYGIWKNGTWKRGIWKNGGWREGTWELGTWKNGLWHSGIWEFGIWKDGKWKDGTWKDGIWYKGTWEYGIWKDGNWEDGTWKDGIWGNGTWKYGIWHKGTWMNGTWKLGIWENGTWKNGSWENGMWYKGVWENGTWKNGTWKDGKWIKGYIKTKYGNLKSTKNPKEYKEYIDKNPKATKEDLEKYLKS